MSVHDDVVAQVGTCSNPACETCPPTEEDLSDAALEGERWPGDLEAGRAAAETTSAGDLVDSDTGEVLKDAPGWDPETKRILNNDGCNFFGGLLRETREAMAENERLAAPEIQVLERKLEVARLRLARAQKPLESRSAWLEGVIRAYADQHKAEVLRGLRKDSKSRRFPSGLRLAWKSGGGEYRWRKDMPSVARESALLEWALDFQRHVDDVDLTTTATVTRPDVDAIKHVLTLMSQDNGETAEAPGLEYVPEHERLDVTVENDK